jgi:hypothetical protein
VRRTLFACALGFACGCSRTQSNAEGSGTVPSVPSSPSAAGSRDAALPASASESATASRWTGSYKSEAATVYVPADWKNVRWRVAETDAGVGEGTITLQIERASGRVRGTLDGPLGPALLDGLASQGDLTATMVRKDPSDRGFTGTLLAMMADGHVQGTLSASLGEASAVRKAAFALSPDSSPDAPAPQR